jgi:hypothetical protein
MTLKPLAVLDVTATVHDACEGVTSTLYEPGNLPVPNWSVRPAETAVVTLAPAPLPAAFAIAGRIHVLLLSPLFVGLAVTIPRAI